MLACESVSTDHTPAESSRACYPGTPDACPLAAGLPHSRFLELTDTLNGRTFALAQQTDGELMMNIC